jgi:hypothetical protein
MGHGKRLIACALPLLLVLAACDDVNDTNKVASGSTIVAPPTASDDTPRLRAPWELARKEKSAVLFSDNSVSMAGYDRGAKSELRLLLNALELQMLVSGIDRFQSATFAEQVGTVGEASGVAGMLSSPLTGVKTCLASPWDAQGNGFRVILTDSVPSAGATEGNSCSCPVADPTNVNCVARAIVGFAQRGNGVWVIGVRATFTGKYYPELPPRTAFVPSNPVRRPVYIWIGGPNAEQGRRIVASTLQAIAAQGVKDAFAMEVWPGKWSGIQQGPLTSSSFRITATNETRGCGGESSQAQVLRIQDRSLVLKKPQGASQVLLSVHVPTQPTIDDLPASIIPLVEVTTSDDIDVQGARTIWLAQDRRGGCFELQDGHLIEWQTPSTIVVRDPRLQDWSTRDDAATSNVDRTLFVSELWDTTARLLASPQNQGHISLLRAVFQ